MQLQKNVKLALRFKQLDLEEKGERKGISGDQRS